jgi:hypothetical protein
MTKDEMIELLERRVTEQGQITLSIERRLLEAQAFIEILKKKCVHDSDLLQKIYDRSKENSDRRKKEESSR